MTRLRPGEGVPLTPVQSKDVRSMLRFVGPDRSYGAVEARNVRQEHTGFRSFDCAKLDRRDFRRADLEIYEYYFPAGYSCFRVHPASAIVAHEVASDTGLRGRWRGDYSHERSWSDEIHMRDYHRRVEHDCKSRYHLEDVPTFQRLSFGVFDGWNWSRLNKSISEVLFVIPPFQEVSRTLTAADVRESRCPKCGRALVKQGHPLDELHCPGRTFSDGGPYGKPLCVWRQSPDGRVYWRGDLYRSTDITFVATTLDAA